MDERERRKGEDEGGRGMRRDGSQRGSREGAL